MWRMNSYREALYFWPNIRILGNDFGRYCDVIRCKRTTLRSFGFSFSRSHNLCKIHTYSNVAYRFKCCFMCKCNCHKLVQAPLQQYQKPFRVWLKVWLFDSQIINNLMQIYYALDNDNDDSCIHMRKWKYIRIYDWTNKQTTKQKEKHSYQTAYTCSIMWYINTSCEFTRQPQQKKMFRGLGADRQRWQLKFSQTPVRHLPHFSLSTVTLFWFLLSETAPHFTPYHPHPIRFNAISF